MQPPKSIQHLQDEEYQLTFLLDEPLAHEKGEEGGLVEHVLHLPQGETLERH